MSLGFPLRAGLVQLHEAVGSASKTSAPNPSTNTRLDTQVHVDVYNEHDTVSGRKFTTSWLAYTTPTVTENVDHDY